MSMFYLLCLWSRGLNLYRIQGRIQDLWKGGGGGGGGYRERCRRKGFWRVPFEDPLWNFKGGGARAPCAPP